MSEDVAGETPASGGGATAVAELTGLHGAFAFPERLLQQIWLRGDFDARALRLRDGRSLRIVRRGRWNRLAGPDFQDAELRAGEGAQTEILRGDVEVHLRAADWEQHEHARDPAYDGVVLHVVLFPSSRAWTEGAGGRRIPILELLPLLERDLEAYAEEAAVEALAGRPFSELRRALGSLSPTMLTAEIERHAARRWANKVVLAGRRIEALGWEEACHQSALEVLGYKFNRAPMLAVAERWPLSAWRAGVVSPETAWAAEEANWRRGGVRPANQPKTRLAQYARWVAARPDWPTRLAREADERAEAGASVGFPADLATESANDLRLRRKALRLNAWRKRLATEVIAGVLSGSRFDTLVCDAWLPLLATRARMVGKPDAVQAWERLWRDWPAGDAPAELTRLAREFGAGGSGAGTPLSQGHLQGLLGWLAALPAPSGRGT